MADKFLHEALYRGQEAIDRLSQAAITICGAGALGSHFVDTLARQGARRLMVIDQDRVEEHNIGTQLYDEGDVGAFKAEVMQARCFRATGIELDAVAKPLTEHNIARLLRRASLVIDTFDNSASRKLVTEHCRAENLACLHLGMNADYGEIKWNETYRVPGDVLEGNACEYPLARNLILIVVALGSEAALRFLLEGQKESYSFTLRDLSINREL